MKRHDIEKLRDEVGCQNVLETSGFMLDMKESTRRALKYRRGDDIIIVTHAGRGWFDPLSEAKGDVFALVMQGRGCDFTEACVRVAGLAGVKPLHHPIFERTKAGRPFLQTTDAWIARSAPWQGSATWRYLRFERCLPATIIRRAIDRDALREGPYGSMWAAHTDETGTISGWEARGREWRGFATGGAKILFRFGTTPARRLCITEAAIDALSLAALEGMRERTLYLSTGGGWAPATVAALRKLAEAEDAQLVAATDNNSQGEIYADRLRTLASEVDCSWMRLRPPANDWNEVLKIKTRERKGGKGVPHPGPPHQGSLRPAEPALDPGDRHDGGGKGVMKD